tara:strand:+ start:276 stop:509 length:234 start_codon:yes stop_codon:yes gene_type:complete
MTNLQDSYRARLKRRQRQQNQALREAIEAAPHLVLKKGANRMTALAEENKRLKQEGALWIQGKASCLRELCEDYLND